jgi:hypothetical protein
VKKHVLISTVLVSLVLVILEYLKGSCGDYLQDVYVSDFQIYFQQSYFKFDFNNLLCHGSVLDVDIENEVVTVLFNTKFYLIASQIFLLMLFIVQIKFVIFDTKKVIFLYIFLSFLVQIIFNLNFGINLLNELSIQQLIFFISIGVFLNENK